MHVYSFNLDQTVAAMRVLAEVKDSVKLLGYKDVEQIVDDIYLQLFSRFEFLTKPLLDQWRDKS